MENNFSRFEILIYEKNKNHKLHNDIGLTKFTTLATVFLRRQAHEMIYKSLFYHFIEDN